MPDEIKIHIMGMIYNQSIGGTYSLVLAEDEGKQRRFSVLIGESEAQSIVLKLNNAIPPRPLSHDLMLSIITMLNGKLSKVVIYNIKDDIFYCNLYIATNNSVVVLDARTSDAVALAVRSDTPMYINADILDMVGTVIDTTHASPHTGKEKKTALENYDSLLLKNLTPDELQELLNMAIADEKYEIAAEIRDEMERRK